MFGSLRVLRKGTAAVPVGAFLTPPARALARVACVVVVVLSSGCAALGITALGVGAGVGVNHTLNGIVYKTFAEPLSKVKRATLTALRHMEIPVETIERTKQGELIKAKAMNRAIEVEFEAITPRTTRMRVIANSDGFIKDSATATEIIMQTERVLPAT